MWDLENNAFPVTGQGYKREIEVTGEASNKP